MSCSIFICSVARPEEDWFYEKDDLGDNTGNLIEDDLDFLQSVDFYYVELLDCGNYLWHMECVSRPYLDNYLSDKKQHNGWVYYAEDSKNFSTWQNALVDLADIIAFKYCYGVGNIHRFHGINHFRLNCEPYFLDIVRDHMEDARHEDYMRSRFGKMLGGPIKLSFEQPLTD